jgi:hypothetical protein
MDDFTRAYIACALWSSCEGEDGEIRLDEHDGDISPETLAEMEQDCADFQAAMTETLDAWYELGETSERAGHDFWLTRNRHGAGFWDRYYNEPGNTLGNQLSTHAKAYGSRDLYIGDDNLIYQV